MTTLVLERLTEKHREVVYRMRQLREGARKLVEDNSYWCWPEDISIQYTVIDQELAIATKKCRRLMITIEEVEEIMLPQAEEEVKGEEI